MEKSPTKDDLIYDACLLLPHKDRPAVERYVSAILDCDFKSDALPLCQRDDEGPVVDIIMVVSDFCELPPMLPHILNFVEKLWLYNRGDWTPNNSQIRIHNETVCLVCGAPNDGDLHTFTGRVEGWPTDTPQEVCVFLCSLHRTD